MRSGLIYHPFGAINPLQIYLYRSRVTSCVIGFNFYLCKCCTFALWGCSSYSHTLGTLAYMPTYRVCGVTISLKPLHLHLVPFHSQGEQYDKQQPPFLHPYP